MLFVEFPITGNLRIPLLIMEWISIIICIEISIIFLIRYRKEEKELRNLQELGYFSIFLGFSLMLFFYIIGDYYATNDTERYLFLNFGYFTIMIGAFFFLLCVERYRAFLFKRYLFTILFLICSIGFVIVFFVNMRATQTITYIFWPLFLFFLVIYLIDFVKKVQNREKLLIGILKYLSGIGLLIIGFFFTTDIMLELLGLEFRLVGAIFQLIGLVLLSLFFITLPPFSEFDWQDKIEVVFVINKGGLCLFHKAFIEKYETMDEHLISAAITSVNVLLEELTGSKGKGGISVLKKKGQTVVIWAGKLIWGVLYTTEDLNFTKVVLKNFVEKFETLYRNILLNWDGDLNIFQSAEIIANDIFRK